MIKRPKDILSQPYHIQEYINYLERKNSSLHSVSQQRELLRSYNKFVNEKCLLADGTLSNFEIEKFEERNCG